RHVLHDTATELGDAARNVVVGHDLDHGAGAIRLDGHPRAGACRPGPCGLSAFGLERGRMVGVIPVRNSGRAAVRHGDRADLDLHLALECGGIDHFGKLGSRDTADNLVDVEQVCEYAG